MRGSLHVILFRVLTHPGRPGTRQPAQHPLALARTQLDPVKALQVLRQELTAPFRFGVSGGVGRFLQVEREALHLLAGELRWAPSQMVLAQSLHAVQVQRVHPALDGARVFAEPPRDLVTTGALGDQQYAAKPQQEALLARCLDRGVDQLPDRLRVAETEFAQGVTLGRAPDVESRSCGSLYVASGITTGRA